MSRKLVNAILLTLKGGMFLLLALVDWMTAKANVSDRGYLIPSSVAREFHTAIGAAWRGQRSQSSLLACTRWNHNACGPSPGDRDRSPYGAQRGLGRRT
ncbi:MAG: hypothetical protein WAZ34_02815 [Rhodocyclaceae bacterium]